MKLTIKSLAKITMDVIIMHKHAQIGNYPIQNAHGVHVYYVYTENLLLVNDFYSKMSACKKIQLKVNMSVDCIIIEL